MKANVFLVGCFVLAGLFGTAPPAFSQSSPPSSEKAREVEALVNKAAALIDSKGKAAFAHFRLRRSTEFRGSLRRASIPNSA
jgi:methyl-accepting chemotaxis protein